MKLLFTFFFLFTVLAEAALIRPQFEGVRQMGMGNAFTALADDETALWYNPAGLARIRGTHSTLVDIEAGFEGITSLNRLIGYINGTGEILGDNRNFIRVGTAPYFATKYFAMSMYASSSTMLELQGLQIPDVDISSRNDVGVIAGVGVPAGKYLSGGFSVKAFYRAGMDRTITPFDLLTEIGVSSSDFLNDAGTYLLSISGMGYAIGLNAGIMVRVPLLVDVPEIRLSATVEDFGVTTFRAIGDQPVPDPITPSYNLGLAVIYDWGSKRSRGRFGRYSKRLRNRLAVTVDYRRITNAIPLHKQLQLGVEWQLPGFILQGGFHQGDWTAGIGIDILPHTSLWATSYAYELSATGFRNTLARVYLTKLTIGFDPF